MTWLHEGIYMRRLGLVSLLTAAIAAGIPVLRGPLDWQSSISYSWSRSRRTFLALAIVMSLAGAGICVALVAWVIPHYHLPVLMYVITAIAYLALMGVAWVPMLDRPGEHSYRHGHFLGGAMMATLAIIAMASVVWFGAGVSTFAKVVGFSAMLLATTWPLLFFSPVRRVFLAAESLIALAFLGTLTLLLIG